MTVTLYGAGCSSTRKARQWFKKHEVPFVERNILRDPLSVEELQEILRMTVEGTDEIISTRSKVYKELNMDFDSLSLPVLLDLFHKHPRLLRSPIVMDERRLQIGYHDEDIRQFLPRETRKYQWLTWKLNHLNTIGN